MKEISSKRSKTDADYEEMARLEFFGSLYMTTNGPIIPANNLTSMIINGAKKERKGKDAGAGIFVQDHAVLEYDGPRTAEEMWKDERFVDSQMVVVQRNRILRTRPIFNDWAATVVVEYEETVVNPNELDRWITTAGVQVGLGDYRPEKYGRYGRFAVEVLETVKVDVSANGKVAEKVTV